MKGSKTVTPSCPSCKGTSFEVVESEVKRARFRHNAVCCSSCGCIVSTDVGKVKSSLTVRKENKINKETRAAFEAVAKTFSRGYKDTSNLDEW